VAGPLAARVLSDHVDAVTLVERDRLSGGADTRRGVPQGRHAHGLLARGGQTLNRLYPDLMPALRDAGATMVDRCADMRWYHFGGYAVQFPSGTFGPVCSRPLLEREVRRRVLALPNVSALDQHDVADLLVSDDRTRVVGITIRGPTGERRLEADLVVDATGRGSRSPSWLEALGYSAPAVSEVKIGLATLASSTAVARMTCRGKDGFDRADAAGHEADRCPVPG